MNKDLEGYFSKSKVVGNKLQRKVNVPTADWRFFDIGSKIKICPYPKGYPVTRTITSGSGGGKLRIVTISSQDWDNFPIGQIVKLYPLKQTGIRKSTKVSKSQEK